MTLSPLAYHYQHRAEIEAVVQGADRNADFDTLCASVGAALAADRTLGGLCDWGRGGRRAALSPWLAGSFIGGFQAPIGGPKNLHVCGPAAHPRRA